MEYKEKENLMSDLAEKFKMKHLDESPIAVIRDLNGTIKHEPLGNQTNYKLYVKKGLEETIRYKAWNLQDKYKPNDIEDGDFTITLNENLSVEAYDFYIMSAVGMLLFSHEYGIPLEDFTDDESSTMFACEYTMPKKRFLRMFNAIANEWGGTNIDELAKCFNVTYAMAKQRAMTLGIILC